MQKQVERVVNIPLEVKRIPFSLAVSSELPTGVNLYLKGTHSGFANIDYNEIKAVISLNRSRPGKKNYRLLASHIKGNIPDNIRILKIVPERVEINLSPVRSKRVKVVPRFEGKPKKRFDLLNWDITPKTLRIKGPASIINEIIELDTELIPLGDLSTDKEVEVGISKNISSLINFNEEIRFKVNIVIGSAYQDKISPGPVAVMIRDLSTNFTIQNTNVLKVSNVHYEISYINENSFNAKRDFHFFIKFQPTTEPGTYIMPIEYETSDFFIIKSFTPPNVFIELKEKAETREKKKEKELEDKKEK